MSNQRRPVRSPDSPEAKKAQEDHRKRNELHERTVKALKGIRDALD